MNHANYLEVLPGGHCFICHQDYESDIPHHLCFIDPLCSLKATACGPECYKEGRYMASTIKKICPHCKKEI